jgi:hypothetical protein
MDKLAPSDPATSAKASKDAAVDIRVLKVTLGLEFYIAVASLPGLV